MDYVSLLSRNLVPALWWMAAREGLWVGPYALRRGWAGPVLPPGGGEAGCGGRGGRVGGISPGVAAGLLPPSAGGGAAEAGTAGAGRAGGGEGGGGRLLQRYCSSATHQQSSVHSIGAPGDRGCGVGRRARRMCGVRAGAACGCGGRRGGAAHGVGRGARPTAAPVAPSREAGTEGRRHRHQWRRRWWGQRAAGGCLGRVIPPLPRPSSPSRRGPPPGTAGGCRRCQRRWLWRRHGGCGI